jgi:hypothetical protein
VDIIWVGQNNGAISKSSNATSGSPTWTNINVPSGSPNPLPNRYVGRIFIDPSNSNIVYAAFGGFAGDNLWKTVNGGTNWTDITGSGVTGLPDAPIRGIALHPTDANYIYVSTEVGVFQSSDGGGTWSTNDFGPAAVSTDDIELIQGTSQLLAATHGRGLWSLQLPDNPVPDLASISPSSTIAGHADFTLNLTGTNFISGSKARWNGADLATTYVDGTHLQATVPASLLTTPTSASVTVFNPGPGGGTSVARTFTVKTNWDVSFQTTPASGVNVVVSPTDANGNGAGVTPFGRQYANGSSLTLSYPAQITGRLLYDHRQVNGVTATGPLVIDGDKTVTGVYVQGYNLNVQSTPTGAAMTVWTLDYYNRGNAVAPFTRLYKGGVAASVTAPAQLPGKWFDHWDKDGVAVPGNNRTITVNMDADHTIRAVYVNTFTVTVQSTNPSAVPMQVWVADKNGLTNGTTTFTRLYATGTTASFTAPGVVGTSYFLRWNRNGASWLDQKTVSLSVQANNTIDAIYATGAVMTVNSVGTAAVPITVWVTDKSGLKDGVTSFSRLYAIGQTASLSAPANAGGQPFKRWLIDGVPQASSSRTVKLAMGTDHTFTVEYGP